MCSNPNVYTCIAVTATTVMLLKETRHNLIFSHFLNILVLTRYTFYTAPPVNMHIVF